MWLVFALTAPFFWAVVHVLDEYCVDEVLEKPWMGVVTSAISSCLGLLPVLFAISLFKIELPSLGIIVICLLTGALIQLAQCFYFTSLSHSEAGIVSAYWNLTPALLPLVSFFLIGEVLSKIEYLSIFLLIFSSSWMCLLDTNKLTRLKPLFLMTLSSGLMVIVYLLESYIYRFTDFVAGFFFILVGLICAGVLPLVFRKVRTTFQNNLHRILPAGKYFILIEIFNLIALFFSQLAIKFGIPSLVSAVQTTIPAYTFILSIILFEWTGKLGNQDASRKIHWKMLNVALMAIGVFFASH